jgi:endonuclease/exonuclease/phosphatase family metal-dependent hydrolase
MAKNPNPKLLAGDFNTSPSMGLLRKLPDQLVDQTRALTSIYPVTWSIGSRFQLWRLDWLFTTHDVAVHSYQLLDPQGLSDHKAQKMVISTR